MNIIKFLEILAERPHFDFSINDLINSQSPAVKAALFSNNSGSLTKHISNTEIFANELEVVRI